MADQQVPTSPEIRASKTQGTEDLGQSGVRIPAGPPFTAPVPLFSEIATFAFWMTKEGYSPATIQAIVKTLKAIAKAGNK